MIIIDLATQPGPVLEQAAALLVDGFDGPRGCDHRRRGVGRALVEKPIRW